MDITISERNLKAINMYQKGLTQKEISTKLRMCEKTLRKILKENNIPPYTKTINCNWCGKTFTTKYRHQNSCSESCRGKYNKRHRGKKQKCIRCGTYFVRYKENTHCSDKCYRESQKESKERKMLIKRLAKAIDPSRHKKCIGCGIKFFAHNISREYCSDECYRFEQLKKYNHICKECGRHYTDNIKNSAGCSEICKRKRMNRIREITRRKKLRENGKIHWNISVERLYKRDKGICHICNNKVDMNDIYINEEGHHIAGDYYPSIDHVIPVSKGGTHTWDNVKLAHRICNTLKSDETTNNIKQLTLL